MIPQKLQIIKCRSLISIVISVLVLFICVSLPTISAYGATYYVSTSGDDSNPGTESQPWRTIQHASDTMVAGDSVYIRGGVYNENVRTVNNGNANDGHIVFSAYPGETPIIDGTGVDASNGFLITHSYIKLIGLEIRNWNGNAIWVEHAAYFEISDCVVREVTFGIGIADGSHDFVLNRVVAHHYDLYGFDVSPSGGDDCYNGTFNDCIAHTGRDPQQNVDGFALGHGNQHNFVFNRCETYNVFDGFDISARDTTLNRCSAHDCNYSGFKIWQDNVKLVNCLSYNNVNANVELDWDGQPGTTTIENCTLMDAQTYSIWIENSGDSLHMSNTILAGGDNIGLAFEQMGVSNYQGDYNVFQNDNSYRAIAVAYTDEFSLDQVASGAWTSYSGQDAHSIVVTSANELFVDPVNYDLHLTATSAAIDKGTSAGAPSEDYEGNSRPQGMAYDIGAYEYGLSSVPFPNIKANSSDGPLIINQTDSLSVTVSLDAGGSSDNADWWVAVSTPFDWFYLNAYTGSWLQGLSFTYQGSLFNLTPVEVLNISGLPAGTYIFYFAVDTNMNGSLDIDNLYYDYVSVTVQASSSQPQKLTNLFFLHHSTGDGLIVEGDMRNTIANYNATHSSGFEFWDHGYNYDGLRNAQGEFTGTNYDIPDDNTDPEGLYYLWISTENRYVNSRNLILNNHHVIAFKSCFPASDIQDQETLQQYKNWYLAMRDFFDTRQDRLFIVMSTPPLHRLATDATTAANARAFANWLCSNEYLSGHPNVRCFDLFDQLAHPNDGSAHANMLRYEYEFDHSDADSHPNILANQTVGPVFAEFLCNAAISY